MLVSPIESPLTVRVLRYFLWGGVLIFLLITTISLTVEYNRQIRLHVADVQNMLDRTNDAVSISLWNYDTQHLEAQVRSLALLPGVQRVEVFNHADGIILTSDDGAEAVAALPELSSIEQVVDEYYSAAGELIGRIVVTYTGAGVLADVGRRFVYTIVGVLVSIFGFSVMLLWFLNRDVISVLVNLSKSVDRISLDDPSPIPPLKRSSPRGDELDMLHRSINHFVAEISAHRRAREEAERKSHLLIVEIERLSRIATVQTFATTVAHELNQPLGAILGNAETALLVLQEAPEKTHSIEDMLQDIVTGVQRAAQVVRSVRDMVEKRDQEHSEINVQEVLEHSLEALEIHLKYLHVLVQTRVEASDLRVVGNETELQQVLLNLLSNAAEAISAAGTHQGLVNILLDRNHAGDVRLILSDNGPGLDRTNERDIFAPFYTTKPGGMGLGLWISQILVERHRGTLEFCNLASGGAQFTITLPAV